MRVFNATKGLPVVTLAEGGYAGKLDDFQFEIDSLAVLGFRLRAPGFWGGARGVAAGNVVLLGRDYVLVRDEAIVEREGHRAASTAGRAWFGDWAGRKVVARRGVELGTVDDVVLDDRPSVVRAWVLDGGRVVVPGPRAELAADSLIVDDERVVVGTGEKVDSVAWWARLAEILAG
ncbi:MAG: PRC-barrel domain-containing protein [Deltaproteobacteria bacterium]|nr:PRC-barrel domain-containing protein [Deltaproteobacteria bacterium]